MATDGAQHWQRWLQLHVVLEREFGSNWHCEGRCETNTTC